MAEGTDGFVTAAVNGQEEGLEFLEKMLKVAQPERVFGQPQTYGEYTIITASEAVAGMGYGFGVGGGEGSMEDEKGSGSGSGGGGGGGGASSSRPVAVISVGPRGVTVEPVIDATKIMLAMFTTLGSMLLMLARMRSGSRD
ncbi:MAG: spore germination protein GerW family protein [Chloroflexota bacterium]